MTKKKEVKKKVDWRIVITAIVALAVIEIFAMMNGINGTLRTVIIGIIAALAGWVIPSPKTN